MAVYDTEAGGNLKVVDSPSDTIKSKGTWFPRETAILQDLPQDSLVVDVGATLLRCTPLSPPPANCLPLLSSLTFPCAKSSEPLMGTDSAHILPIFVIAGGFYLPWCGARARGAGKHKHVIFTVMMPNSSGTRMGWHALVARTLNPNP